MTDYDPDLDFHESQTAEVLDDLDPEKVQHYIDLCRTRQNLPLAFVFGIVGMLLAVLLWVGITVTTNHQVGWMAAGLGAMIGLAIRWSGRGIDTSFGILGAWLAVVGCLAGDLVSGVWFVALGREDTTFAELVTGMTPELVSEIYRNTFGVVTLIYYAAAMFAAYKFGIRKISKSELVQYVMMDSDPGMRHAA